jgi:diaminopimelate epimerase
VKAAGYNNWVSVVSMGNPHAVMVVGDVEQAPVSTVGPAIENHPAFPERVNVGFLQAVSRTEGKLRVWERGAGETLACGTGACAAAVAGMRRGLFDSEVELQMHGGRLRIEWDGTPTGSVFLIGPAATVFTGEIDVPAI